ncbi:MAG TPA: DoxX family protein [Chloroflexia bacterium]|nr:DoxX family protein [Chloroflexia bacterium]
MKDIALLLLRGVSGGLVAGHGAQKLFGWFGGGGIEGTMGMVRKMNLKPTRPWAYIAALSEFGGGALTALGLLNPAGPVAVTSAMSMATAKVHWGKPIWNSSGGPELPIINMSAVLASAMLGPGKLSLDNALGIHLPKGLALGAGLALAGAGVATGLIMSAQPQPQEQPQPAQPQPQAEQTTPEHKPQGAQEQEFVDETPAPVTPANASAIYFGEVHPVHTDTGLGHQSDAGTSADNPA